MRGGGNNFCGGQLGGGGGGGGGLATGYVGVQNSNYTISPYKEG